MSNKRAHSTILMVEDADEDFETMSHVMRSMGLCNPIYRCIDDDTMWDYLRREGRFCDPASAPRPILILLDLNLGSVDGRGLLRAIKKDPAYKDIVVIVLTTSNNPRDIKACYSWGANAYAVKPIGLERVERLVEAIQLCWLDIMENPT